MLHQLYKVSVHFKMNVLKQRDHRYARNGFTSEEEEGILKDVVKRLINVTDIYLKETWLFVE